MDKREWLLAATALGAVLAARDVAAQAPQAQPPTGQIGTTGAVNPAARGTRAAGATRVLLVGSELFQNERIQTDAGGQAHLMFADQSALTVGPNSDVTLDRFVYDPARDTGSLAIQASRGVLRFVGGRVSKTGDVSIRTPSGTVGIRGGITIVQVQGNVITVFFLFGDWVRLPDGSELRRQGYMITFPGGSPQPITPQQMASILNLLQGGNLQVRDGQIVVENGRDPVWIAPNWAALMAGGFGAGTTDWSGVPWFGGPLSEGNNQDVRGAVLPPPPPPPPIIIVPPPPLVLPPPPPPPGSGGYGF